MLRRESYLTFPDQKDANARFYTRVGTPKYLVTKPIENQVNIVTTLVTRIKAWKSRKQWKGIVLMSCPFHFVFIFVFLCTRSFFSRNRLRENVPAIKLSQLWQSLTKSYESV